MPLLKNILHFSTAVCIVGCTAEKTAPVINYLNLKPPGNVAELFAPGLISTDSIEHSSPAFSPDGSVVLWTVVDKYYRASMLEMSNNNGDWSSPHRPSFADSTADDYYPSFSPDGKTLYFSSRRKMPPGYAKLNDMQIWQVERTDSGWAEAVPFDTAISKGHEYAHSITRDGTLYFSASSAGGANWNLHAARKLNGVYEKAALLPFSINSADYEDGPYISPDEDFLIFDSQRSEGIEGSIDLYIAFRDSHKQWTMPINMGPQINSAGTERFARLSPDGKYLFFGSTRLSSSTRRGFDIFWADAKIIDSLKVEATKIKFDEALGIKLILALDAKEFDSSLALMKQWVNLYPQSLDGTLILSSLLRKQKRYAEADQLLDNFDYKTSIGYVIERALIKFGLGKDNEATQMAEPILGKEYDLHQRCIHISQELLAMGKLKKSDEYFEKAMTVFPGSFPYFRRACTLARIGEKDRAFKTLNKAVELGGYNSKDDYETNADLQSLKTDPRWKTLIAKLN